MPLRALSLEKRGPPGRAGIAFLTMRRPETQNAIDGALLGELSSDRVAIEWDEDVRVVVLATEGEHFCLGWDAAVLGGEDRAAGGGR